MSKPIIVIAGPTASGKTSLALKLAKKFRGEIINADSRSIYREMDIATSKPTIEERQQIPHHLIDIIRPEVFFNQIEMPFVNRFQFRSSFRVIDKQIGFHILEDRNDLDMIGPQALFKHRQGLV
jgi:cytidylate kinase